MTAATLNDDDLIDYTQGLRKMLADDITEHGTVMPTDKDERHILLAALDGISKTSLGRKRIQTVDEGNKNTAAALAAMDALSKKFGNNNPFIREGNSGGITIEQHKLPAIEVVPGNTDIGVSSLTYDEFSSDRAKEE